METIHVVLCGREGDTLRVRGALHGSATMPHAAWSRKYVFACSAVTRMRDVDATLRDVCHVIVLCSSSSSDTSSRHDDSNTSSSSSSSDDDDDDEDVTCYGNRPVLALDTAASSTRVAQLRDEECFYGICTLAELRARVLRVALAPSHLVYDALLRCLTPCGRRAYHRAFWLLDTDDDGVLTRDDVRAWRQATLASATTTTRCTDADVTALLRCAAAAAATGDDDTKASDDHEGNDDNDDDSGSRPRDDRAATADADATASHARGMGERAFVALHTRWLARGDALQAWATLQLAGTQPTHGGAPYTWHDLHAVRVDAATNTYLSPHAVQFFRNVYKRRYVRDVARTWSVTPGCPWHDGCYDVDVDSNSDNDDGTSTHAARHDRDSDSDRHRRRSTTTPLSLDAFIEQWKYLALERRDVVVQYARYWAYKGSSSSLFVRRRCRAARDVDETPPDTIQVLVVGAAHAGKRTLIDMLTANDDYDDRVAMRTTTRHAQRRRRHNTTQQHRHTVDDSDDDNDVVSDGVSKLSSSVTAAAETTTSDAHNDSGSGSKSSAPRPRRPRSAHASRRDVDSVVGGGRRHDNNNNNSSNTTHTRRTGTASSPSPAATAAPRLYVRTTTRLVQRRGGGEAASSSTAFAAASEAPQTIIYTTLVPSSSSRHGTRSHASMSAADDDDDDSDAARDADADAATVVLCNASLNKTFDAVLLCCDASALPRSTRYIAALYTRAAQSRNCARMPFVVVLTKSDALAPRLPSSSLSSSSHTRASAPRGRTAATTMHGGSSVATMLLQQQRGVRDDVAVLRHFCVQQQLLWPPVLASTHAAYASSELAVLSEHVYALVCTPDLAIAAPPLTPVRLLRRATLVTMLLVAAAGALHRVARYVRQRRLHAS